MQLNQIQINDQYLINMIPSRSRIKQFFLNHVDKSEKKSFQMIRLFKIIILMYIRPIYPKWLKITR